MASGKSFPSGEKEMCKEIFTSLWTELDDGRMSGAMAVTLLPNPRQSINQSICTYIHTYIPHHSTDGKRKGKTSGPLMTFCVSELIYPETT